MKKLGNWILAGIAVMLPIGVTIYAIVWLFNILDGILSEFIFEAFGRKIPGLGIVVMVVFVLVVGILASNVFGKTIINFFSERFSRIPIIKMIYNPVNKIVTDFSSKNSDSFQKVVVVDFPMKGSKSIGFITNSHLVIDGHKKVSVFVPTVPNPTNGHMIIVDASEVGVLDVSISEGVNMVITMGSVIVSEMHTTVLDTNHQ